MPSYTLELEIFSLLNGSTSDFEIFSEGSQLGPGYMVSSTGTSIVITVSHGGALPSSLEFRFDDADGGTVDQIEVRSVQINDRYVNMGNFLSTATLNDGGVAVVDVGAGDFLFDDSEPAASEFTTGATQTFTNNIDGYRGSTDTTPQVFDLLGGAEQHPRRRGR